jgi:hypothetical protein
MLMHLCLWFSVILRYLTLLSIYFYFF